MGNSVLDYNVFGRIAGIAAASKAKETTIAGKLNIDHIKQYEEQIENAKINTSLKTPILLPEYRNMESISKHLEDFDPFLPAGL